MKTKTINGKTYEVYTQADWNRDRELKVKVGQLIEPVVYWQLLGAVPPQRMGDIFQVGEAYTHNRKGEELFTTFRMVQPDIYEFVGLQTADYELEKK
jgi:hypothetical protein